MALRGLLLRGLVGFICLPLAGSLLGCSRADLYPVTRNDPAANTDTTNTNSANTDSGGADPGSSGAESTGTGTEGGEPSACSAPVQEAGDSNRSVVVNGTTRNYVLHLPPNYAGQEPVPLVVDFHGVGGSGMSQRSSSPYPNVLDPDGVVMAFPDGLRGPAGTAWNVGPCCVADVDDVAFTRALVLDVQSSACIDPSRIYAVGVLTGGGMAHHLGCEAADLFAAVAPAAFDLLAETVDDCVPSRPITVVSFRGTASSRVPYEGGASSLVPGMPLTFLGAQGTFEAWGSIDGCVGPASAPDAAGCTAYSGCRDGAEVILCTQPGGEEPGDPSVAWPVLKRHQL